MRVTLIMLLAGSTVLRAALVLWGVVQDALLRVPYTDADYKVFTDAARHVTAGGSPYDRSTYRYSPLLAYAVLPNVLLTPIWGKVLFSAGDILAGWQLWRLARLQGAPEPAALVAAAAWLCNPFTFTISTRGSCDALVANMLLGVLLLLGQGSVLVAALLYGLAVHVRIYPIVYAPSIVLFLAARRVLLRKAAAARAGGGAGDFSEGRSPSLTRLVRPALVEAATFGGASCATFLALGALFYRMYGVPFLQEAFLHHLARRDPRHCFSAYWYPAYLSFLKPWPAGAAAAAEQGLAWPPPSWPALHEGMAGRTDAGGAPAAALAAVLDPERLAVLPQAAALLALALALHQDLPFCWLLQTIVFVAFNKVSTAQYFVWWFCLLPAALPGLRWPPPRPLALALAGWVAAQLHWLLWGYLLEFDGQRAHLALWGASVLFLAANAGLVVMLLHAWHPQRSFLAVCLSRGDKLRYGARKRK